VNPNQAKNWLSVRNDIILDFFYLKIYWIPVVDNWPTNVKSALLHNQTFYVLEVQKIKKAFL